MGLLVLGSVAGVAERLVAGAVLADEGPLPRVAAVVDLQVLKPSKAPRTSIHLYRNHLDKDLIYELRLVS